MLITTGAARMRASNARTITGKFSISAVLALAICAGCNKPPDREVTHTGSKPAINPRIIPPPPQANPLANPLANTMEPEKGPDIDTKEILARGEPAESVLIRPLIIQWETMNQRYRGKRKAAAATITEAAEIAETAAKQLRSGGDINAIIAKYDAEGGECTEPSEITQQGRVIEKFKQLALRLKMGEVGIVRTDLGYMIAVRVPPSPPDPRQSAEILARDVQVKSSETAYIQVVSMRWRELEKCSRAPLTEKAKARDRAAADQLATDLLARVRGGEKMEPIMAEFSDDRGSAQSGKVYQIAPETQAPADLKNFILRMKINEAGLIRNREGWHLFKRLPPPPPDPMESAAILAREPTTSLSVVKHILIGWKELGGQKGRPAGGPQDAPQRDRKGAEKLVKELVSKLNKGAKIEALMAEYSEDPGSAQAGTPYTVQPGSGFVKEFLQMALRLKVGEVGVAKSDFGLHVMKRTE